jgi:predicted acylesterase/phospholipase RssA
METKSPISDQTSASTESDPGRGVKRPYRIFSFPGAGFDTVMQMGVVHAMLVTRRRAPEMVAGISVGAITATALGEVLRATGGSEGSSKQDEEVRVARFSELLEAFRNAPSTVLKGFLPDPLETNAAFALKPVELPRHFKEERDHREESVASRTGLIRLFNHLIRLRVSVRVFTQLMRILLGWNAFTEKSAVVRWRNRGGLLARLWWLAATHLFSLSMPLSLLARVELSELFGINGRSRAVGVDAGHIIFNRWGWLRRLWEHCLWLFLGLLPLTLLLILSPAVLLLVVSSCSVIELPPICLLIAWGLVIGGMATVLALIAWRSLSKQKSTFTNVLKHYQIFNDLGDSYALMEVLVQNFDPGYYGEFKFYDSVQRALKHEMPTAGGSANKKVLADYLDDSDNAGGVRLVPLAANLANGRIEAIPQETSVVDALMCACAVVPFYKAQSIQKQGVTSTFIDGISVSNDPIVPVYEEACKILGKQTEARWDSLRIVSVPLLPLRQEQPEGQSEPYTGLVDVALRARELQRFQDMLLDKSLIDRVSRALGGKAVTVSEGREEPQTFVPAKIRLVAPDRAHQLTLRMTKAGSVVEQRELIDTAVADGCRAMIERLVTDALPDTRTLEERQLMLEPDEEEPDEWPHRDPSNKATLREAVGQLRASGQTIMRRDGTEYVSCRKLMAAWGDLKALPGGDPVTERNSDPGPGISEVCRCCMACAGKSEVGGVSEGELRQHVKLPRLGPAFEKVDPPKVEEKKGPAVVFLFSGGVFRGVFQVGFANAVSELGIHPDVIAGASVGTIIGALTGRIFQKPAGHELVERQRQTRQLAATFLTIDRFVLTDRFADFIRHFSIHAADADFSPHDLDLIFRRYEKDSATAFSRRARRVFSGMERLFCLSPFEILEMAQLVRASNWDGAAARVKTLTQEMMDRYGVGLEMLGPEPLQQLIDGIVFDGKPNSGGRFDHFDFPLMGTTTNLTQGTLDILRSTHPWDPRFTQGLLASSAFPMVFRPRWSWEVYRHPQQVAQYADGGIMDNLPLGAVIDYLWGKDAATRYERRPDVPHLILTATLEPEKADWTKRADLDSLCWTDIRARAGQLRYNGKIDKFQGGQRDIRRILKQRTQEGDSDVRAADIPLNLDVLAVKPKWLCGTFAFHPMLGFSREKQAESIAHGCASTICAVADHFDANNKAHAVDVDALRGWAMGRGIALGQLPERIHHGTDGVLGFGPARLSEEEQKQGFCWFRKVDPATGKRPICPFHSESTSCEKRDEVSEELQTIYVACGARHNHVARGA